MAEKPDKTSLFMPLAIALALILLAAGGIAWLQQAATADADPGRATLAALSQSVALHASRARTGDDGALDALATDLERLATVRESTSRVPGNGNRWDELQSRGRAIVERRDGIVALTQAADGIAANMPDLLAAADELLENTGAVAAVQDIQGRAQALQDAVTALPGSDRPEELANSIGEDLARLRQVSDALGGAETPLDIAALPRAAQSGALASFNAALAAVEANAELALANVDAAVALRENAAAVAGAADDLRGALTAAGGRFATFIPGYPWLVPGLLGAALVLVIVLAIMHSRSAVFERAAQVQSEQNDRNQQAILRLLDELGSLADGDLTVEATVTEDITGAIADSINYAIEKLRELVATINETAIMVDSAAKQTESTAVHMARAAENQNREISAASESIVSMAASIEEVSGNAERSSDVARHSVDVAHKGGEAVRRTIDGMNAIRETIQDTSKRIKRLGESSQEIGNIIELINDIAEQTNILALNASIQASMAGEAGRGFAVVADEVQRLAERSTNATKQIEVLVRTIQADTNEAVVSMERSTTDVVGGALLAENAGAALDEIEQVSNQIASLVQNISSSAREQAGSAADVTKRTTRLKEISAQTGKATTATAAAISKLSELASQLRQTVAGFTLPSAALESRNLAAQKRPESRPAEDKAAG